MKIKVGVSNRHIHLKDDDLKKLFGLDYKLDNVYDLNQPGQFATSSFLTIKTDKDVIENVRVLGPTRPYTQIEISRSDAYKLGLNPPLRDSGDLEDSEVVTLIGPNGSIKTSGCIIARRHIHITSIDKIKYNLPDVVSIYVNSIRGGVLDEVYVKISDPAYFELHLDTDEANALDLKNNDIVEIKTAD